MVEAIRLLPRLFGGGLSRGRWIVLFLLVAATSGMEALAAALVFALAALLSEGAVGLPVVGTVTTADGGLAVFGLATVGVFLFRAGVAVLHDVVLYRLSYGAGAELEERLLRGYLALPPRVLRRRGHAELVRNVHDTVMSAVEECLIPLILAFGDVLRTVAILAVMTAAAPFPTLLAAVVFAPLLWVISVAVRRPARKLGEVVNDAMTRSLGVATETLNLAGEIRMAGRSRDFSARFGQVRRRIARAGGTQEVYRGIPRLAAETVLVFFVIGYVWLASARGDEAAVLPTLGLFAYAALRVLPSLIGLVGLVQSVAHAEPALLILQADEAALAPPAGPAARQAAPGTIALAGVTVRLPETGRTVLQDVDLEFHRGDVVAIVGPNGAGKSTLLDVLAGVLAPDAGTVTVDGRPLAEREGAWPEQVAIVPQHVHLLDADIATNITLDPAGESAEDPRLLDVVSSVGLAPVIERLAGRTVGEEGRMLSGGERQRVAVARALYRETDVLLVDEGTSALDSAARRALLDLVTGEAAQRITVLVTHDAELAAACSRTITVERGRVREDEKVGGRA